MKKDFNSLQTVIFSQKMKPAALKIYKKLFPGCNLEDLREKGVKVHILDKEFGIDSLLHFSNGQWISVQEKYRSNFAMSFLDFTQEHKNAHGTPYESDGEWFHLGAQIYFYGWANKNETDFEKWFLMDIAKYKILVAEKGGIEKVGKFGKNKKHGGASFYGIPVKILEPCFITDYRKWS